MKPGDLVRYKKRYECRSEFHTNGILIGILIRDVTHEYAHEYGFNDNQNYMMFEVLFGKELVVIYKYEIELVNE